MVNDLAVPDFFDRHTGGIFPPDMRIPAEEIIQLLSLQFLDFHALHKSLHPGAQLPGIAHGVGAVKTGPLLPGIPSRP